LRAALTGFAFCLLGELRTMSVRVSIFLFAHIVLIISALAIISS